MTLEILHEWVFPILCVTAALALIAVGIFRDRATQKELDRLYTHEDKVAQDKVYIEIHDGDIANVKADSPQKVLTTLADALGAYIGRWLPEGWQLGGTLELVNPILRAAARDELKRQGRLSAATPTRQERLLEEMESRDFTAALLQLGTEDMNRCAWCDPEKRRCGCESCEPQRERQCVLQWLNEKPDGDV